MQGRVKTNKWPKLAEIDNTSKWPKLLKWPNWSIRFLSSQKQSKSSECSRSPNGPNCSEISIIVKLANQCAKKLKRTKRISFQTNQISRWPKLLKQCNISRFLTGPKWSKNEPNFKTL